MNRVIFIICLAYVCALTAVAFFKSLPILAAVGVFFLVFAGVLFLGLCVLAGQISRSDRDEANGTNHPDDLGSKN